MHLFKNKTKDVKQFLDEMKANKTNRSSNLNSLEKRQIKTINSPHHEKYQTSQNTSIKNSINQTARKLSSSIDSNKSFDGSLSNQRSVSSMGHKFYASPPQPTILHQRTSQEQMNFKTPGTRPFHNQSSQHSQSYEQHISDPSYHQHSYSNRSPAYHLAPKQIKFEQPTRNVHQSYHNMSQPISYQSNENLDGFYDQKRRYESPQNFSQTSNSTIYESPQYYQSNKISYSNYQKPLKKTESSHFVNQAPNQRISRQTNQYDQPRSQLTNSQQVYNRFDYSKPFASQVSVYQLQISNIDYPMEEIREAEAGMSTEKDSPAKFTQYLSKHKNETLKFIEAPMNNFAESNVFEVVHFDSLESQVKEISPKFGNSHNLLSFNKNKNQVLNEKQPALKIPQQMKNQQSFIHSKQASVPNQTEQKTRKIKIKVSEQQKYKLNKSLHQSYEVYLTLDGLFKETSILFNNIQRSSDEFNKKISQGGIYFKCMNPNAQKLNQKMEIQDGVKVDNLKPRQTYKKQKPKINNDIEHKTNVQRTYKKTKHSSDIEI